MAAGAPTIRIFRYGAAARQRAWLLAGLSMLLLAALIGVLVSQWAAGFPTRILGVVLIGGLLLALRAQLARLTFQCLIDTDAVRVRTLFGTQTTPWSDVVQVRRVTFTNVGTGRGWACTLMTRGRSGNLLPTYLFDHQLEDAEAALAAVVRATPRAEHHA